MQQQQQQMQQVQIPGLGHMPGLGQMSPVNAVLQPNAPTFMPRGVLVRAPAPPLALWPGGGLLTRLPRHAGSRAHYWVFIRMHRRMHPKMAMFRTARPWMHSRE
jgi:hypothetical protein